MNRSSRYLSRVRRSLQERDFSHLNEANYMLARFLARQVMQRVLPLVSGKPGSDKKYKNVLFVESTGKSDGWGLGDGLFKIPAIEKLAQVVGAQIDVFCAAHRRPLFENHPDVADILSPEGDTIHEHVISIVTQGLASPKYDLVVTINPGLRMQVVKMVFGLLGDYAQLEIPPHTQANHIERNLIALKGIFPEVTYDESDLTPHIRVDPTFQDNAREQLSPLLGKKTIGIMLSAKSGLKDFHRWHEVIEKIDTYHHERVGFVLLGVDTDRERASQICQTSEAHILDLVGQTPSLAQHYALLSQLDVVVGTDGGSINAAIALGIPVVDIFNIIEPTKILPPGSHNSGSQIRSILAPCENRCHGNDGAHVCRITGQSELERDRGEVPCLGALESTKVAGETIEVLFGVQK